MTWLTCNQSETMQEKVLNHAVNIGTITCRCLWCEAVKNVACCPSSVSVAAKSRTQCLLLSCRWKLAVWGSAMCGYAVGNSKGSYISNLIETIASLPSGCLSLSKVYFCVDGNAHTHTHMVISFRHTVNFLHPHSSLQWNTVQHTKPQGLWPVEKQTHPLREMDVAVPVSS